MKFKPHLICGEKLQIFLPQKHGAKQLHGRRGNNEEE
jgi:hypothetical protein